MKKTIYIYIETPIGKTTEPLEIEFENEEDYQLKAEEACEEEYKLFIESISYGFETHE